MNRDTDVWYIAECGMCKIALSFSRIDLEKHGYKEDSEMPFTIHCPFCGKNLEIGKREYKTEA